MMYSVIFLLRKTKLFAGAMTGFGVVAFAAGMRFECGTLAARASGEIDYLGENLI